MLFGLEKCVLYVIIFYDINKLGFSRETEPLGCVCKCTHPEIYC